MQASSTLEPKGQMEDKRAEEAALENTPERPDVSRFTDYREYLRAMIVFLRAVRPGFSFRSFARRAGFASPNYLKLVADGMRNLAPESIDKFARGLGLSRREHEVFRILVLIANARSDDERNALFLRLRERVVADEVTRLRDDQFAVYEVWWALVMRDMAQLPDFRLDARWIGRRLRPRIRPGQAQRALDLLLRLGLIVLDDDGRAQPAERTISTGPQVQSLAVRNYHRSLLGLASRALDEVPREERNITSVTVILSEDGYREAVEEIAKLRRRLLEISDRTIRGSDLPGAEKAREVYAAIFALQPVTQPVRERKNNEAVGASVGRDTGDGRE